MIRSGCPNCCWYDFLVREAYVRPHTALDIFSFEDQFPENKVKGEPADIIPMAEYAWYEWIKFRDTSLNLPSSKIQLSRDLGTTIDMCPAMARNVLNIMGNVMYYTSMRALTPDEIQSPSEKRSRLVFGEAVEK
jgi:hypothetical protein